MDIFNYPPTLKILKQLAEGSLKQNLPKALRLWVILRSLYGESSDPARIELGQSFTVEEWKKEFSSKTSNHAKTMEDWLFDGIFDCEESDWKKEFETHYNLRDTELNEILANGKPLGEIDSRVYRYDFNFLVSREFLIKNNRKCQKVKNLPKLISTQVETETLEFQITDLASSLSFTSFLNKFNQKIEGETRFHLKIEDIIPVGNSDKVESLQIQLEKIWHQKTVPPVLLTYHSAKLRKKDLQRIVYPVFVCYYRRGPYLIAYGQSPQNKTEINWYDYRIDHIVSLEELNWSNASIPSELLLQFQRNNLPNFQEVKQLWDEALGFEFYKPAWKMFLWFDPDFHENYIKNTDRDSEFSFCRITAGEVKKAVKRANLAPKECRYLLSRIDGRPQNNYYRIDARENDNHVVMRLRAWGPNVEVILPYELRQRMTEDMANTWKLYQKQ